MSVPIQNVYYLLCYAWDHLEARSLVNVDAVAGNRVEDLLGKVLQEGVAHLIKSGLDRGYVVYDETGRRLRGKVLLTETLTRMQLQQGRVACQVDELSHDVPHNRVIKATMNALVGLPYLDARIRVGLQQHCRRFYDVADVDLTSAAFRHVQLHRNLSRYAFLINVCQLIARSFVPDERTGVRRFNPFTANDQEMGLLFESFVRNFLRREQTAFRVSSTKVPWDLGSSPPSAAAWLPDMRTDVMLTNAIRRVVVETKCSTRPYQEYFGSRKLRSGHLYQLMSYLSHLHVTRGPAPVGVLLYAGAGPGERLDFNLRGHTLLIRSLDLNRDWRDIHCDLVGLAAELEN
jgi:5-methylcytosine-specific restriction enzyme subunit McrC